MQPDRFLDGRLKLRQLNVLVAIAEQGSLVRAADTLHASQPVLSRTLKELETLAGGSLFTRLPSGVEPTGLGEIFVEHARLILARVRAAEQQITGYTAVQAPTVRVGTHPAGANLLVPRAIGLLKQNHPDFVVIVREGSPLELRTALTRLDLDVVIGRSADEVGHGLVQRTLFHERIVLATRRAHPATELPALRLEDLLRFSWIFPLEDSEHRIELENLFLADGLPMPANRIECTSMLTLRALLLDGDLIAALPESIAWADDSLDTLPLALPTLRQAIGVTIRAESLRERAVVALVDHLAEVAAMIDGSSS